MSNYIDVSAEVDNYIYDNSVNEPKHLTDLRLETAKLDEAKMMTLPYQAQYLGMMLNLIKAKKVIEIGVFTGYATAWMALALPKSGQLIACDISEKWMTIGKPYWHALGLESIIKPQIGPATQSLQQLIDQGYQENFDAVFIDADKQNYELYYELSLPLLKKGGLILFDNLLWSGKVANSSYQDEDTESLRSITKKLHQDNRVDFSLVTIADGLGIATKK